MKTKTLRKGINTGVLIAAPKPGDYIAGAVSAVIYTERLKDGQWHNKYRPTEEKQIGVYFDTMSCVTFAALNSIEEQVAYLVEKGLLKGDGLQYLKDLGFFDENGKFNASDRFTAIMSNTTKQGNYLNAVWESIRVDGILPEKDLPSKLDDRTPWEWEDWMDKKVITDELKEKAKKVKNVLQFAYEWVSTDRESLKYHAKQAPLQIAAPVCSPWNTTEIIKACSAGAGHSTLVDGYIDKKELKDFDHYNPFAKRLAWDYKIAAAIKGVVEVNTTKLLNKISMIIYKEQGKPALYVAAGDILITFATNFDTYKKDFESAKIIELAPAEFAKFKVAKAVSIKAN